MSTLIFTNDGHIALAQTIYNNYLSNSLYLAWGTLPAFLGSPTNLTATAGSGVISGLSASTYVYSVTATTANGETTPSAQVSITLASPGQSVNLSWSAISGAVGYNVYGRAIGTGQYLLATGLTSPSYTDAGGGAVAQTNPPSSDTTSLAPWSTNPTTPNVLNHMLFQEVGRRRVSLAQYVVPSANGSLVTANGTWAISTSPTKYLYLYTNFALTDASTSTIYQYGFFVNTVPAAGLTNSNYLTPGQVASPGTLLCLQNVSPIYRDGSSVETHSCVMTF